MESKFSASDLPWHGIATSMALSRSGTILFPAQKVSALSIEEEKKAAFTFFLPS